MNKYETVFIINDELGEEQTRDIINKIEEHIANNGKITKVDNLGKKKMAYDVKGHSYGYYFVIEFETAPKEIYELKRLYRITEEILKFIVVNKED